MSSSLFKTTKILANILAKRDNSWKTLIFQVFYSKIFFLLTKKDKIRFKHLKNARSRVHPLSSSLWLHISKFVSLLSRISDFLRIPKFRQLLHAKKDLKLYNICAIFLRKELRKRQYNVFRYIFCQFSTTFDISFEWIWHTVARRGAWLKRRFPIWGQNPSTRQ